ncbi:ROK family transcriptional regulator [Vibrio penaeicida]|uniref:ROK family transcriptional regulator n=1 Tax=Vibrio penaeicida TaxID=104609 RepID=UPI0027353E88|nr:ROK family transcriptional regulator [Vibrio penaeicida]MDP2573898.1 ROK family transcriptional regulator [Vibrio penaeicida]
MKPSQNSKIVNLSRVIDSIWRHNRISRVEVAEQLGLDKSTITKIVGLLTEKNLISEVTAKPSNSKGGRPKVSLSLNSEIGVLVGIELTDSVVNVSVVNVDCLIVYRTIIPFQPKRGVISEIAHVLTPVLREIEDKFHKILAIGIGLPGLVDPESGQVSLSNALEIYKPLALVDKLRQIFAYPIFIDNDANCAAWGEMMQTRREPTTHFIYVLFTSHHRHTDSEHLGIGLGFVLNNKLFYGDDFSAGQYKSELVHGTESADLSLILQEFASSLVIMGRLMNIHNVIIGGEAQRYGANLVANIDQKLANTDGPKTWDPCISFSTLGTQAVSAGAAAMAWQKLITQDIALFSVLPSDSRI